MRVKSQSGTIFHRPRTLAVTTSGYHDPVIPDHWEDCWGGEFKTGRGFALFHVFECEKVIELVKNKVLNQRDISVLFAIMSKIDTRTGRARFVVKNLATEFGVNATSISASISRLKKAVLIATFTEYSGDKYYLVNPYLFSVGTKQRWGLFVQKFSSAFE